MRRDGAWLGCVLLGLLLVGAGSVAALDVMLTGNLDSAFYGWRHAAAGRLAGVGVPGPRLWPEAMLQRSIGGAPGPLGVRGMTAAGLTAAGFLLVTAKPARERRGRGRRAVRWGGVLLIGAAFGAFIANDGIDFHGSDDVLGTVVPLVAGAAGLPLTLLLWLHLARIARRLGDRRLTASVRRALVLTALAYGGGVLLSALLIGADPPQGATYQAQVANAQAMQATLAVPALVLAALAAVAGIVLWVVWGGLVLRTLALLRPGRRIGRWLARGRFEVTPRRLRLIGAWLLVLAVVPGLRAALRLDFRHGLLGNLPVVGWPGPKLWATPLVGDMGEPYQGGTPARLPAVLLSAVAAWLLTTPADETERASLRRLAARWWAAAGLGVAVALSRMPPLLDSVSPTSAAAAQLTVGYELAGTVLLYAWLGRLDRRFHAVASAAGLMIALPLVAYPLSGRLWTYWNTPTSYAAAGLYGAAAAAVAAWAAARLLSIASVRA